MGTQAVSKRRHEAGAHVQAEADRRWQRLLFLIVGSLAVTGVAFVALGGHGLALIEIELVAILVMVVGSAATRPSAERWERGAAGVIPERMLAWYFERRRPQITAAEAAAIAARLRLALEDDAAA